MIIIIRIRGIVGTDKDIEETFSRINLRRKYSCTILNETKENLGMIKKLRNFSSYGKIDKTLLSELIKTRARLPGDKPVKDAEKIANELEKGKTMREIGIKPFFRLQPPRKGINSKLHYPKGVLGENKDLDKLLRRML